MKWIVSCLLLLLPACQESKEPPPLRVGWAAAFAGVGQILATAEQLPELSAVRFLRFSTGPEMNEAALQGQLDVVPIGIVPAAFLLARSPDWSLVARIYRFKQMTVVAASSNIYSGAQLHGKKLATGFGTGAHPYLLSRLKEWGLKLGNDVALLNVAPTEQVSVLQQGAVDAVAAFEPVPAILKSLGQGRMIDSQEHVAFILVRNQVVSRRKSELMQLLQGLKIASFQVAQDRSKANALYARVSRIPENVLSSMEEIEPNLLVSNREHISLKIEERDLAESQLIVDHMERDGLLNKPLSVRGRISTEFEIP